MNRTEIWHRHLGVYGICVKDGKLLVIRKSGGPYTGRYDLPGGSLEPGEPLVEAIRREFREETGITVEVERSAGVRDYIVPWRRDGFDHTHCHHIALFYEVSYRSGDVTESPRIDDSRGAEWIEPDGTAPDDCSPLVLEAIRWLGAKRLSVQPERYERWNVKSIKEKERT